MRSNLKFLGTILFALVFLTGGVLTVKSAQAAYTQADFAAFDGVNIGTNSYTVSSHITATDTTGTGTESDPVKLTLTGNAPIVTPWFMPDWTTYNYVTIGIKLPTGFTGTRVYQTGVMQYTDANPEGIYVMGAGSTDLATTGDALHYLDFSFGANKSYVKNGLVFLKVIWNADSLPEYFTIDVNGLQLDTPTHKFISTVEQLRAAIKTQADYQTWTISAGNYGLNRFNDITVQGETGWYFPVTANNVTIEGQGNPVIYGNEFSLNGNLSTQNLISVFGNNVTLKGLTLMPKAEGNKTIEVLGNDINIEDVVIQPNTKINSSVYEGISNLADKAFSKEWGGSIFFSHAGNHTVKNVTINNGGVSFRYAPANTHIKFDDVNIVNKTANNDVNSYRYSSGFNDASNSTVGLPKVIYKVDNTINNLVSALAGAKDGDVIEFTSDITTSSQLDINKAITLDGADHTLTAGFSGGSVILISKNGVTIKNLIEDGGTTNATPTTGNRGINIYKVTGVLLDNVTASNNSKNGIVVNGSTVIVNKITTSNNGWESIDVDMGDGVTTLASLTVNGISVHNGTKAAIRIDNTSKTPTPTVIDTILQYSHVDTGNTRDYFLLEAGQTAPNENGTATVTDTNKDVVVTSSTQPIIITGSVTDATIDVKSLPSFTDNGGTTNTTATLPAITLDVTTSLSTTPVKVEIPTGTVVTAPAGWDGTINAPTIKENSTVTATPDSGMTSTVLSVIEVGYGDVKLTFDKAVRILIPGQAGKFAGYSRSGVFTEITSVCAADNQTTGDALPAEGDCKKDVGSDLVIWTKHFTTFATYTQTAISHGNSSYVTPAVPAKVTTPDGCEAGNKFSTTTGRNCNAATPAIPGGRVLGASTSPTGQVLGAEKFNFTILVKNGSKGNEIIELQNFLNTLGYTLVADGKFGPKTKGAVIKFQLANKLVGDGVVGAKTRAVLNK